jgi:hypothetical protein
MACSGTTLLYFTNNTWWAVQVIKFLIMHFIQPSATSPPPFRSRYSFQCLILKHAQSLFPLNMIRHDSNPYKLRREVNILYILILHNLIAEKSKKILNYTVVCISHTQFDLVFLREYNFYALLLSPDFNQRTVWLSYVTNKYGFLNIFKET